MIGVLLLGLGQRDLERGLVVPLEHGQRRARGHLVPFLDRDPHDPGAGAGADVDDARPRARAGPGRCTSLRVLAAGVAGSTAFGARSSGFAPAADPRHAGRLATRAARQANSAIGVRDVRSERPRTRPSTHWGCLRSVADSDLSRRSISRAAFVEEPAD